MTEHSKIGVGGSTCERVLACPPSRLTVAEEGPPSEDARIGTMLHDHMEQLLTVGEAPVTDEILEHGWKIEQAVAAYKELGEFKRIHVEQRLHIRQIPGAFGTVDLLGEREDNRITIADWKFGQGIQVWPTAKQLLFYGAAALSDPSTRDLFNADTVVELAIIQPNDRGLDVLRRRETTVLELFEFTMKLRWAVANGDDETLLNPGDHCKWCPAKPVCPKLREMASKATQWKDPHEMSDEELVAALDEMDALEAIIAAVRGYAYERAKHGKAIPGYKVVAKHGRKAWIDEEAVVAWAKQHTNEDIYTHKLKSPAAVGKLVKGLPEDLYEVRSSGTVLVPESDKRPAVVSGEQFEGLAQQIKLNS